MKLSLLGDWKIVIRRAWSIRLIIVAGLLSGAEIALQLLDGYLPIPPYTFAALSALASAAAFVARLVAQDSISGDEKCERDSK